MTNQEQDQDKTEKGQLESSATRDATVSGVRMPFIDGGSWSAATVSALDDDGWRTYNAATHSTLPGVAVRELRNYADLLCITHIASGCKISCIRRDDVAEIPGVFAELREAGNWLLSAEEVNADPAVRAEMATVTEGVRLLLGDSPLKRPFSMNASLSAPQREGRMSAATINAAKCVAYLRRVGVSVSDVVAASWNEQEASHRAAKRAHNRELKRSCGHFRTHSTAIHHEGGRTDVLMCSDCNRPIRYSGASLSA